MRLDDARLGKTQCHLPFRIHVLQLCGEELDEDGARGDVHNHPSAVSQVFCGAAVGHRIKLLDSPHAIQSLQPESERDRRGSNDVGHGALELASAPLQALLRVGYERADNWYAACPP